MPIPYVQFAKSHIRCIIHFSNLLSTSFTGKCLFLACWQACSSLTWSSYHRSFLVFFRLQWMLSICQPLRQLCSLSPVCSILKGIILFLFYWAFSWCACLFSSALLNKHCSFHANYITSLFQSIQMRHLQHWNTYSQQNKWRLPLLTLFTPGIVNIEFYFTNINMIVHMYLCKFDNRRSIKSTNG